MPWGPVTTHCQGPGCMNRICDEDDFCSPGCERAYWREFEAEERERERRDLLDDRRVA